MSLELIINIIQTVGFPIAICIYLFFDRSKSESLHKEETDKLTETVNNNTLALQHLADSVPCLRGECMRYGRDD